jgi:methionine sulfoxide reductase catalytic subunit
MTKMRSSDVTAEKVYLGRRAFIAAALAAGGGIAAFSRGARAQPLGRRLTTTRSALSTTETANSWEHVTSYNNFYEFGTNKNDPAVYAPRWEPKNPWTVTIEGECAKKGAFTLEDILKGETLEDRIYRHRCVEAWSMVIPWVGFPLANLIKKCEPTSRAHFVEFTSIHDPQQMRGQRTDVLRWPYIEGLRLDEARHPLTILSIGVYGVVLPNQNGAPLRLVVPWKYGFKSAKSIVKIRFTERQPLTAWAENYPDAYGFYANVNPKVDHPNWSQAREARLPSLFKSTPTQPFNGYGDQVAALYKGMDLTRNY